MLRDPTAKGVHRANYCTNPGEGKRAVLKPESDWVLNEVEPIVDEELWTQCNQILDGIRQGRKSYARRAVQLFGGLVWCGCGQKMYVASHSPKYVCEKCHNKISMVDLEAVFYEQLKGFFLSPEEIAHYLQDSDQAIKDKETLLRTLESEQERVKREMDRLYRLYADGEIPSQGFGSRYRPMEDRYNQLEDEIPRLQAEIDLLKISHLSSDQILAEAHDLYGHWPSLDHTEKRKIIDNITDRITIGQGEISIELCYLPSAKELPKDQITVPASMMACLGTMITPSRM